MKSVELRLPARGAFIPATLAVPEGSGYPLCALIHGFQGDRHENGSNTELAAMLAESGIASVRMDFPGCGDSNESFALCTLSNMVADVCQCVNAAVSGYGADIRRIGLMGLSLGGRVAMEIINRRSLPVKAVSLSSPAADNQPLIDMAGGEIQWNKNYDYAKAHGCYMFCSDFGKRDPLSPEWFEELLAADSLGRAKPFEGKMQVILAEDDNIVPPALSRRCAAAYGAELVDISGDGHSFGIYSGRSDLRIKRNRAICDFFTEALISV